jgi:hypothetical protein
MINQALNDSNSRHPKVRISFTQLVIGVDGAARGLSINQLSASMLSS